MKTIAFLVVLMLSMVVATGCTTLGFRCFKPAEPENHGLIRTEGALIKNKTIAIPPEGLMLIDVIEQCERKVSHSLESDQRQGVDWEPLKAKGMCFEMHGDWDFF